MPRHASTAIPSERRWRLYCCVALAWLALNALNAQNLVTNPGFENGTTGWYGSQLTTTSGSPHSGSACGSAMASAFDTVCGQDMTGKIQPGQTYTWSAWLRVPSGSPAIFMDVALAGSGGSSSTTVQKTISTVWTPYSITFSSGSSGALTSSIVRIQAGNMGLTLFLDDVSITNSSPVLALARTNESVLLSWSTKATNYALQTATNLAAPVNWAAVTNAVQSNASMFSLTFPATNPASFFRLQHP